MAVFPWKAEALTGESGEVSKAPACIRHANGWKTLIEGPDLYSHTRMVTITTSIQLHTAKDVTSLQ